MFCTKSNQSGFRSMMARNFKLLHTGKQDWREVYVGGRGPVLDRSSSSFPLYIHDYIQPPQQHLNKSDSRSSSAEVQESRMWPPSCPPSSHRLVRASGRQLQVDHAGGLCWMWQRSSRAPRLDSSCVWLMAWQGSRTSCGLILR